MTVSCEHCGTEFAPSRPAYPSRFCTSLCRSAAWQRANRERFNAGMRDHYSRNRDRLRATVRARRVGLLPEDVDRIRTFQEGVCGCCGGEMERDNIDHCHRTGIVRGVICTSCNNMLAKHGDSIEKLRSRSEELKRLARIADCAIEYLADPPASHAL